MAKLNWMQSGTRLYEAGISRGVLYVGTDPGVAWTGLTSVDEKPSGGDPTPYYLDGVKFLNVPADEEYSATIKAFTYPDEFAPCIGNVHANAGLIVTAQRRKPFSFSYQTKIGNDLLRTDFGYKIHLVYNALAAPSDRTFQTLGSDVSPVEFSWEISTKPPKMSGYKNSAHLEIDSRHTNPVAMGVIEDILYGTDLSAPRIPELAELIEIFIDNALFNVTDNGDGSYTVSAPDSMAIMISSDVFQLISDSAVVIDADTYSLTSL